MVRHTQAAGLVLLAAAASFATAGPVRSPEQAERGLEASPQMAVRPMDAGLVMNAAAGAALDARPDDGALFAVSRAEIFRLAPVARPGHDFWDLDADYFRRLPSPALRGPLAPAPALDNAALDLVPTPGSVALVGMGGLGVVTRRGR